MKRVLSRAVASALVLAASLVTLGLSGTAAYAAGTVYYVDCGATTNGSGTQASPWNSTAAVSSYPFVAGDSVLFRRGRVCNGALTFGRAGTTGNPITIDAYGSGALPVIDGRDAQAAVQLTNPSNVTVANLEIRNATRWDCSRPRPPPPRTRT